MLNFANYVLIINAGKMLKWEDKDRVCYYFQLKLPVWQYVQS